MNTLVAQLDDIYAKLADLSIEELLHIQKLVAYGSPHHMIIKAIITDLVLQGRPKK